MNLAYLEIDYHRSAYDAMSEQLRATFMDRLVVSWLYHEHALEGVVLEEEDIWRALSNHPCRSYCDRQIHKQIRRMYALFHQLLDEAGSQNAPTCTSLCAFQPSQGCRGLLALGSPGPGQGLAALGSPGLAELGQDEPQVREEG